MSDFRQRIEKLSPKRLALLAMELQAKLEKQEREHNEPIAIIGIGCRIPGSGSGPEAFWNLLENGVDAITETPKERWDVAEYYDSNPDAPGGIATRHGAYLSKIDLFDAPFFSISRREAVSMDPQQRMLLEVCWEALENAGHSPRSLSGTATGVFLGICSNDYHDLLLSRGDEAIDAYLASGVCLSVAAGRISYTLGLQGPSMSVDTACSASLVSTHLACQSLRTRESRVALAGGVNLTLSPESTIALSRAHMMAPDGRCKTFDSRADGFVRGEGCGIVVLKRLSDAIADADNILAVIRGTAVNQDGRSSGITAPNGLAQEALIRQALANGGVKPEEVEYVEAHGTGTSLGDPIEAHALAAVLGAGRTKENPLVVGSVKTNVGHLEGAAGVTGLIKVILSLQHEQIPANLHFQKMNPHIDWGGVPVEIPVAKRAWRRGEKPRIAGLSSFGFSGTNAHLIVEEAPRRREREKGLERPLHILALSARNEKALEELAARYEKELAATSEDLGDICYTANAGRAHFENRIAVVGETAEEVGRKLSERKAGAPVQERTGIRPVFLFSGQGSQYAGMGKVLYETQAVFRKAIDECEELLKAELQKPLREVLWGGATQELEQTAYTQPCLFALEYAISEVWKSWGIEPGAVLGHSVGEYAAACLAGVYSLADGLKLIATRAQLMQAVSGRGAMLAVLSNEDRVRGALKGLEDRVSIAGLNAPESLVISGYEREVGIAEEKLKQAGVRTQRLSVSHGFHSPQMTEMEEAFEKFAAGLDYHPPKVKMISSVTGKEIGKGEITAGYWRRQVREPVRFREAIETLKGLGQRVYLEVGPGSTLAGLGRQCLEAGAEGTKFEAQWLISLKKNRGEWEQVLESLGRLYERGAEVDWEGFDGGYNRRRVTLPTYPFQRQSYWYETPAQGSRRSIAKSNVQAGATKTLASADGGQVPEDWYLKLNWELKPHASIPRVFDPKSAGQQAELLNRRAVELEVEHGFDQYAQLRPELNEVCGAYVAEALRAAGWDFPVGSRVTIEQLEARCAVAGKNKLLLRRFLNMLAENGVLSAEPGDTWVVLRKPHATDPDRDMRMLQERYPKFNAELVMTARCAKSLAGVLQGTTDPLTLLFPGGSTENAQKIYAESPGLRVFNCLVAEVVASEVKSRPDGMIRVLEVGAGTGGTTVYVAPVLPADRSEYVFTDLSPSLKVKAAQRFKKYPFIRYQTLDIEQDPTGQGLEAGQYDIVIAANVLHATADLGLTMRHIRSLLKPEGMVVLLEGTFPEPWVDLTFGLTDGWWRFHDRELRGTYPLISRQAWLDLLAELGFVNSGAVQPPGTQQVVFHARIPAISSKPPRCLIVPDEKGVASQLAADLRERGGIVSVATSGESIVECLRSDSYDVVLHMSALDCPGSDLLDSEGLASSESALLPGILSAMQAIPSDKRGARLWLTTSGAQPVLPGQSALSVAQSVVWGLGRTFALEQPNSWGGLIDLDPGASSQESATQILATITQPGREDQLAFRNAKRYVARLERCAAPSAPEPRFVPQKNYVITGGLGGLGLMTASWMVDNGARNLILIGRKAPSSEVQKSIDNLRRRGARVEVRSADVGFKSSIETVFREIIGTMGSIDGVLHAAGFIDDGLLGQQTVQRMERVLAPKMAGAWNLHELTSGMRLDFFVLFSSISSLTGSAGTSSYAAANGFMDALAHYRKSLGLPALSVNWGAWAGDGMSKRLGAGTGKRAGITLMPPKLALAALGSALSIPDAQITVGAIDWNVQKPMFEGSAKRPLLEHLSTTPSEIKSAQPVARDVADTSRREVASISPDERKKQLINYLIHAVAPILAIEPNSIDPSKPLTDFGVDSLMALEFRNRILGDLAVSIPTVCFLEGISLSEVASRITAEMPSLQVPGSAAAANQATQANQGEKSPSQESKASVEERKNQVIEYLISAVAPILAIEPSEVNPLRPLTDYGVDSLMALEFRNRLNADLGISIPTVRFLEGISLQEVASQVSAEAPSISIPDSPSKHSTSPSKPASPADGQLHNVFNVPVQQRGSWLATHLPGALAPILGVEAASVSATCSLSDFGLDSLMALEFKNHISSEIGVTIPTVRFLEGPTLEEIASQIATELGIAPEAQSIANEPQPVIEYPLAFVQQQAYFGHKLNPESAAFNVGLTAKAAPHLDFPALQRSVKKLLIRHPSLRAIIVETDDGPRQRIMSPDTPVAFLIDASGIDENELKQRVLRDFQENFELDQPLFRVNVFRLAHCDVIFIKVDHIIIDHWSVQLCADDLKRFYDAEMNGSEPVLPAIAGQYQDFVEWEAATIQNTELWDYWKSKLDGELPLLDIPSSRQRPSALMARGEAIPLLLPPSLSSRVRQVARPLKTTVYTFMLSAFQILLHLFSHQDDIIVGTSATRREDARWANTVGFIVNVLPLRINFSGNPTFAEILARSRETVLGAIKHQEYPFTAMISRLGLGRELDRIPVFQAFFNFLTDHAGEFGRLFMGVRGRPVQFGTSSLVPWMVLPNQEGRIEIGIQVGEVEGQIDGYLNFNSDVVDRSTAELMAAAYFRILEAVVNDPNILIEDLAKTTEGLGYQREDILI